MEFPLMLATLPRRTAQSRLIGLLLVMAILFMHGAMTWADKSDSAPSVVYEQQQDPLFTPDSAFAWFKAGKALLPQPLVKQTPDSIVFVLPRHSSMGDFAQFLEQTLPILPILLPAICIKGMFPDILGPPSILL